METPQDLAARLVTFPPEEPAGGHHHVLLSTPGGEPVTLGPFPNPALARDKLEAVRRFVAAVVREVAMTRPLDPESGAVPIGPPSHPAAAEPADQTPRPSRQ